MKFYKKCESWGLRENMLRIGNEKKKKKKNWLQPGSNRGRPHKSPT